jgi:hypothetical protein
VVLQVLLNSLTLLCHWLRSCRLIHGSGIRDMWTKGLATNWACRRQFRAHCVLDSACHMWAGVLHDDTCCEHNGTISLDGGTHFHTHHAFSQEFQLDNYPLHQGTEWQLNGPIWTDSLPRMVVFNCITLFPFTLYAQHAEPSGWLLVWYAHTDVISCDWPYSPKT